MEGTINSMMKCKSQVWDGVESPNTSEMVVRLHDLCTDEIGTILDFLDDIDLYKIGFVSTWFRTVSCQDFLWHGRLSLPSKEELGQDFVVTKNMDVRRMWIEEYSESYRYSMTLLNRLGDEELMRTFEFLTNYELFTLGWSSKRLMKLSSKPSLWHNRIDENFKKLNEKYYQRNGEKFEPKNVREEYFYGKSLRKRKEITDVEKIYNEQWRQKEYFLKILTFLNDIYYPLIHNITPYVIFSIILVLSIILLLHYMDITHPVSIMIGYVLSLLTLPLGFCLHCGIPGISVRSLCNEVVLVISLYFSNILETSGITPVQRRVLFERLRDRGVKGPNGIPRQIQENYEREMGVVKYGITLIVVAGLLVSYLLYFVFMNLLYGVSVSQYIFWGTLGIIGPFTILSILTCLCLVASKTGQNTFSSILYFSCLNLLCAGFSLLTILGGLWDLFVHNGWKHAEYVMILSISGIIILCALFLAFFYISVRALQLCASSHGDWIKFSERYQFPWWDIFMGFGSFILLATFVSFWLIYFFLVAKMKAFDFALFIPIIIFSFAMCCFVANLCVTMVVVRRWHSSPTRRLKKYNGGSSSSSAADEEYQERLTKDLEGDKVFYGVWSKLREKEKRKVGNRKEDEDEFFSVFGFEDNRDDVDVGEERDNSETSSHLSITVSESSESNSDGDGNKVDLSYGGREVEKEEATMYSEDNDILFFETSAKNGVKIEPIFRLLGRKLLKVDNSNLLFPNQFSKQRTRKMSWKKLYSSSFSPSRKNKARKNALAVLNVNKNNLTSKKLSYHDESYSIARKKKNNTSGMKRGFSSTSAIQDQLKKSKEEEVEGEEDSEEENISENLSISILEEYKRRESQQQQIQQPVSPLTKWKRSIEEKARKKEETWKFEEEMKRQEKIKGLSRSFLRMYEFEKQKMQREHEDATATTGSFFGFESPLEDVSSISSISISDYSDREEDIQRRNEDDGEEVEEEEDLEKFEKSMNKK